MHVYICMYVCTRVPDHSAAYQLLRPTLVGVGAHLWLMSELPIDVVECKRCPLRHNLVSRCVDAQVACAVLDLPPWPHLYHGREGSSDSVGLGSLEGREEGGEGIESEQRWRSGEGRD